MVKVATLCLGVLLSLCAGCDTTVHRPAEGLPDAAPTQRCLEANQHSDFAWIRDNVFKTSCANFSSCHQGTRPPGNLNLTPDRSYAQLVNIASSQQTGWTRVVPGDPERSYLLVKLRLVPGPLGDGDFMPPNSPPICSEKIEALRRWIADGAPLEPPRDAGPIDSGTVDSATVDSATID